MDYACVDVVVGKVVLVRVRSPKKGFNPPGSDKMKAKRLRLCAYR